MQDYLAPILSPVVRVSSDIGRCCLHSVVVVNASGKSSVWVVCAMDELSPRIRLGHDEVDDGAWLGVTAGCIAGIDLGLLQLPASGEAVLCQ